MGLAYSEAPSVTLEQREQMHYHARALAQILYDDAEEKGMSMPSLGEIE